MKLFAPFQDTTIPLEERLRDLLSRLTIEEKMGLVPTFQAPVKRLHVKGYSIGAEGAHGFVDRAGTSTTFPQTQGLASTWDRQLLREIGKVIGKEARVYYNRNDQSGGLSLWFPTIDMEKDPRWGRTEEAYGEDPYLTGELASEIIQGTQGDHPFYIQASCAPKHFFANNNERNRISCSCSVDPRNRHEYYLAAFKSAFTKAKAFSLMTSYNEVNGIPMMVHPAVRDIVKKEWGLEGRGHIVTDGGDVGQTVTQHRYFPGHAETIAAAFRNGSDCMTDDPSLVIPAVREALERRLISEAELDEHVANILRVRFRYGQFDPPGECPYDAYGDESMMTAEHTELARTAARKSVVLLKNAPARKSGIGVDEFAPLLPIHPGKNKKIAIIGPLADVVYTDWYTGIPAYTVSPLEGLKAALPDCEILFESGRDIVSFTTDDGRPLMLDAEGVLVASTTGHDGAARFSRDNWGWGANTLRSLDSGLYLDTASDIDAARQPRDDEIAGMSGRALPKPVRASSPTTLNWFVTSLFNFVPQERGLALFKTWNGNQLVAPKEGGPIQVARAEDSFLSAGAPGTLFTLKTEMDGISAAAETARNAELAIVFVGNNPVINGKEEMDRPDIGVPGHQEALIRAVHEANPNTVVVFVSSYPLACNWEAEHIPALVYSAHGIQEFGNGLADVLVGTESPAGRLSMTWYKSASQLPDMMEYDIISSRITYQYFDDPVLFPFGHGLSYANFAYSELDIDSPALAKDGSVDVSFLIRNAGSRAAEEVPQMYVSFKGSRVVRPIKSLKGFDRVRLEAGESRRLSFRLSAADLAIWDVTRNRFCVEKGTCSIGIGASSEDIRLRATVEVEGEVIPPRSVADSTPAENYDAYDSCYLHERRGFDSPGVFNKNDGAWIAYYAVDFGEHHGQRTFNAWVSASGPARLELRVGSPPEHPGPSPSSAPNRGRGSIFATIDLPVTGDICAVPGASPRPSWAYVSERIADLSGIRDLYIVFYGKVGLHSFSIV